MTLKSLPQITVQKLQAGRHVNIESSKIDQLLRINGVQSAAPRVWGYYYFEKAGVNFSIVGIDEFDKQYRNDFEKITQEHNFDGLKNSMIIGQGVKKVLEQNHYGDYFNFIKPNGEFQKVKVAGVFKSETSLASNDIILMPKDLVLKIFGMSSDRATDIVLKVANSQEVPTIASKIKGFFPDSRVITQRDLRVSYQNIFDYKSGIFLSLFIISAFTFLMIIYDRASGVSAEERREIGVLKALGWRIDDVLRIKFYEAFAISFVSFVSGVIVAIFFVYDLQAPILRDIFMGYSKLKPPFDLPFVLDFPTLFLLFLLTVPLYIAAILIPSWRVASMSADEVMR